MINRYRYKRITDPIDKNFKNRWIRVGENEDKPTQQTSVLNKNQIDIKNIQIKSDDEKLKSSSTSDEIRKYFTSEEFLGKEKEKDNRRKKLNAISNISLKPVEDKTSAVNANLVKLVVLQTETLEYLKKFIQESKRKNTENKKEQRQQTPIIIPAIPKDATRIDTKIKKKEVEEKREQEYEKKRSPLKRVLGGIGSFIGSVLTRGVDDAIVGEISDFSTRRRNRRTNEPANGTIRRSRGFSLNPNSYRNPIGRISSRNTQMNNPFSGINPEFADNARSTRVANNPGITTPGIVPAIFGMGLRRRRPSIRRAGHTLRNSVGRVGRALSRLSRLPIGRLGAVGVLITMLQLASAGSVRADMTPEELQAEEKQLTQLNRRLDETQEERSRINRENFGQRGRIYGDSADIDLPNETPEEREIRDRTRQHQDRINEERRNRNPNRDPLVPRMDDERRNTNRDPLVPRMDDERRNLISPDSDEPRTNLFSPQQPTITPRRRLSEQELRRENPEDYREFSRLRDERLQNLRNIPLRDRVDERRRVTEETLEEINNRIISRNITRDQNNILQQTPPTQNNTVVVPIPIPQPQLQQSAPPIIQNRSGGPLSTRPPDQSPLSNMLMGQHSP